MASFTVEQTIQIAKAHHQAGRLSDAEAIYRQVLVQSPNHADALSLLGVLEIQTCRLELAAESLRRAVAIAPEVARYQSNFGECLRLMGNIEESIFALRAAVRLKPDLAVAHNNLGIALAEKGLLDEAIASYRSAISHHPQYAEAHSNLGNALRVRGDVNDAIAACRQAVQLNPDRAENWNSLGVALAAKGEAREAREVYRRAIAIKPGYAEAHTNLGNSLSDEGQVEKAATFYRRAVELSPDAVPAHWNLAVALLRQGDFQNGWPEHEWRLKARSQFPVRPFLQPQWTGQDLTGQTILLHAEQGFGDTIQFVRYVSLVAARGARVILECQPELCGLLKGMTGAERVIARGDPLPAFDLQCPLLSLPRAFNTTLQTIPAPHLYLTIDPERVRQWAAKLSLPRKSLNVGLCWAGSSTHSNDAKRSIDPARLTPLACDGVTFYSLQKHDESDASLDVPDKLALKDLRNQLVDFVDTAGVISNLDLVISVDTAVAHLAGALGKPVWLLLPFAADWRWLLSREDSPWYPAMRLFRQATAGDWESVLRRVTEELSGVVRERGLP
jgi:tetratricopeptide (TPR) repeat protein